MMSFLSVMTRYFQIVLGTTKIWITIIKFSDEHKNLKQINEEQRESLMDELRGVNLSKFVSEASVTLVKEFIYTCCDSSIYHIAVYPYMYQEPIHCVSSHQAAKCLSFSSEN